jgi:hypothetical protein
MIPLDPAGGVTPGWLGDCVLAVPVPSAGVTAAEADVACKRAGFVPDGGGGVSTIEIVHASMRSIAGTTKVKTFLRILFS